MNRDCCFRVGTGHRVPAASATRRPLCVNEVAAREVAAHYVAGDSVADRSLVRAAYRQLSAQTDDLLRRLMRRWRPDPPRLASTAITSPYATDAELIEAVRASNVLEIPVVDRQRGHPILGGEPGGDYDRFRALHDLVGHVLLGFGFDRNGEFSAWHAQRRYYRGLGRWALATELHAQHSVRWTTGDLAEPKAVLIHPALLRASLAAATPGPRLGAVTDHRPARSY